MKQLQWLFPERFGEDKLFVMMGALHIEMAALRAVGDWLDGSGWTSALAEADVTTAGRAEALVTVSDVTRTRYALEVRKSCISSHLKLNVRRVRALMVDSHGARQRTCFLCPVTRLSWRTQRRSSLTARTRRILLLTAVFTLYFFQVTAAVLHNLKMKAFQEHGEDDPLSFEEWCQGKRSTPQYRFWDIALQMILDVLQMVRALRTANFTLFNCALSKIVPYLFALDHTNYSRYLPIHIRDNLNLETLHPSLWEKFMEGYFVVDKTGRRFSRIALDQAHEQLNAVMKGSGGKFPDNGQE